MLSRFGKLAYFDLRRGNASHIPWRQRSTANSLQRTAYFGYTDQAALDAAVAASPHTVNGVQVTVSQEIDGVLY